jgi:hypothetical protein
MTRSEIAYVIREPVDKQYLMTEGTYGMLTAAHFYSDMNFALQDRRPEEEIVKVHLSVKTIAVMTPADPPTDEPKSAA